MLPTIYLPPACRRNTAPLTLTVTAETLAAALKGKEKNAVLALDDEQTQRLPIRTLLGVAQTAVADALELTETHTEEQDGIAVRPLDGELYSRQFIKCVNWRNVPVYALKFVTPPPKADKAHNDAWLKKACKKIPTKRRRMYSDDLVFAYPFGNLAADGFRIHADDNRPFCLPQAFFDEIEGLFWGDDGQPEERLAARLQHYATLMTQLVDQAKNEYAKLQYPRTALLRLFKQAAKWGTMTHWYIQDGTTEFETKNEYEMAQTTQVTHLGHHPHWDLYINPQFVLDALSGMQGALVEFRYKDTWIALSDNSGHWAIINRMYPNSHDETLDD